MGLQYQNLDDDTRQRMIEEIEADIGNRGLYISNYLNEGGVAVWPQLLLDAARSGTDDSLAEKLRAGRCFKDKTTRNKPKRGVILVDVPRTAAQTLAESQFNMYYIRALSIIALRDNKKLVVYRAKEVADPRPESQRMIGEALDPAVVLDTLRRTKGVEPSIGIPMPNSGLSVQLA